MTFTALMTLGTRTDDALAGLRGDGVFDGLWTGGDFAGFGTGVRVAGFTLGEVVASFGLGDAFAGFGVGVGRLCDWSSLTMVAGDGLFEASEFWVSLFCLCFSKNESKVPKFGPVFSLSS